MKACNDLDFLETYWIEAKKIGVKIKSELPKLAISNIKQNTGTLMYFVKFSDLKDSWSAEDTLKRIAGESKTLKILADKIEYMILKNRAKDVKPMLEKICSGRIKTLYKINKLESLYPKKESLGKGHFRVGTQVYKLNNLELKRINIYFNL